MKKILLFTYFFLLLEITAQQPKPASVEFGFSERIRMIGWDNAVHLGDPAVENPEYFFSRIRTSFSAGWNINSNFKVYSKLTNEFRKYFEPSGTEFHFNEVFVDQLYFTYRNEYLLKGKITVGRQNIKLGEGFLIMDGTPLDGSRSIYFNALRYDFDMPGGNVLTAFMIYSPKADNILPSLNSCDIDEAFNYKGEYKLLEQISRAAGLYFSAVNSSYSYDIYYIHKSTTAVSEIAELKLHTFGGMIKKHFPHGVSITSELAYQHGTTGNFDKQGLGGYTYIDYKPGYASIFLPTKLRLGSFYLSGDDPGDDDDQSWNPLFSRWPKWSESYIYTLIREKNGRVADWNNIYSFYFNSDFRLFENTKLSISFHKLYSFHLADSPLTADGTGLIRGNLFISKFDFKLSDYLSSHLLWEHFEPGNFYFSGAKSYNWLRLEMMFSI